MKKLFAILILCLMLLGCSGGSGGSGHNDDDSRSEPAPLSTNKPFVWNQSNWDKADWQ